MLRSKLLLPTKDHHSTSPNLPASIRDGCEYLLLLAVFGALVSSSPILLGQTDGSSSKDQQAKPQAQICDGLKQSAPHKLSLGGDKAEPDNADSGVAEQQQSVSQRSEESTDKNLRLPQDKFPTSDAQTQGLLCKKDKSGTELKRTPDPSPPSGTASSPDSGSSVPTVSYVNGMLTIHAQNVRLRDVIEEIRTKTGIFVELPAESIDEPVFDHVGPAPLRDALTQFLYGSRLNYVIQTSSDNSQNVTRLILSSQTHLASAALQHPSQPVAGQAEPPAFYGAAGFTNDSPGEPIPPVPVANTPAPAATNVPGVPAGFNVQQAAAASGKTVGQILDEMQKRQLQALDDQSPPQ